MERQGNGGGARLGRTLTPAGAWAFSLGASIGWGSLVITSNTYLAKAGPLGSVLGLLIGAAVMLVIARNYHYMMNCFPEAGGAYAYSREVFGCDHGFLTAWFLALTYLSMLWANATSLPLFARVFLGDVFRVGRLYSLFGYDVYLGEAALTIAGLLLAAALCARHTRAAMRLMVALAGLFSLGIIVCLAGALLLRDRPLSPAFAPDGDALSQIVRIACISPWAFVGFENISHAAEEFSFPLKRSFRVLAVSVLSATLLYVCVTLLSVTAFPPQYASWVDYIRDLPNLQGLEQLPAFYAANHYLGAFGVWALALSLLALVVTSLIANIVALSRLFYGLARDGILPRRCAALNARGVPERTVGLIAAISALIPFVGRTAIGWIVDVTTIGATITYGFVSSAAMKQANLQGDRQEEWTGLIGFIFMIGFMLYLLVPNLFTTGTLETESYFLFVVWSMLGFIYFRAILRRDREHRFGKSIVVWIGLLSLILFTSLVWMSQSTMREADSAMGRVQQYYSAIGLSGMDDSFIIGELERIRLANGRSIAIVIAMFGVSLGVLINNYTLMSRRAEQSEAELGQVRRAANTDPLTGVKSKHAYAEWERQLNAKIDAKTAEPFAVVICDINGLKHVNDTLGHKAGDSYIRAASSLICGVFQHSPVFRIGGDEFLVLLTGQDYRERDALAEALRRRSEENIALGQAVVSVGLSEYAPEWDATMRDAFERADALMYQHKQQLKALGARTR